MKKTNTADVKRMETCPDACKPAARRRGRPLSFDRDKALEDAMHVFWERGYEGASISDLTAAMGITPPSLYAAFGDKEHLFLEAVDRYVCGAGKGAPRAEIQPTARQAVEVWLHDAAIELTSTCHPRGCMVMTAAANCSAASVHIHAALAEHRTAQQEAVRTRIEQGIADGELPTGTDAAALADFYVTVLQGMSFQARDGASREQLLATAEVAMRAWPASDKPKRKPQGPIGARPAAR